MQAVKALKDAGQHVIYTGERNLILHAHTFSSYTQQKNKMLDLQDKFSRFLHKKCFFLTQVFFLQSSCLVLVKPKGQSRHAVVCCGVSILTGTKNSRFSHTRSSVMFYHLQWS